VQGEGAYAVIRKLTMGEIKAMKQLQAKGEADDFDMTTEVVQSCTLSWNWVDDDDAPLPQPREDPTVLDAITDDEFAFLAQAIAGSADAQKN